MKKKNGYKNNLLFILFLPVICAGYIIYSIFVLLWLPQNIREYRKSNYYADFRKRFSLSLIESPQYLIYEAAKNNNIEIQYFFNRKNDFEYFIYDDVIYLFPDFEELSLNEGRNGWNVTDGSKIISFESYYESLIFRISEHNDKPVRIIIERGIIASNDLSDTVLPENVKIVLDYEEFFNDVNDELLLIIPQNVEQLYDMMLKTKNLAGEFVIENDRIKWKLYDDFLIEISINARETYINIEKQSPKGFCWPLTHYHSDNASVYNEICHMGKKGNVMVIRSRFDSETILYQGPEKGCPYAENEKVLFGKYYYLRAK